MRKSLFFILALALALSVSAGCSGAGNSSSTDEAEAEIQLITEDKDTVAEADTKVKAEVDVQFSPQPLQVDHQGGTLRLGQIPSEERWYKEDYDYNDENEWIDMVILSCEKNSTSGYFAPETIIYETKQRNRPLACLILSWTA